jgi:hypothetical protein
MFEYKSSKLIFPISYDALCRALSSFKGTLSSWQISEFNLVKVHAMTHYVDSIRQVGSPFEYSANMYEHLHIVLLKQAY